MKAIIVHSASKRKESLQIAEQHEGDLFIIEPIKRPIKLFFFQLIVYGYLTALNRKAPIKTLDIDFSKYDEIVLISPVWAGRVNAFMRQFLKDYPFTNKKVTIIASCKGGYDHYFKSYEGLIDPSNTIIDQQVYIKGIKQ